MCPTTSAARWPTQRRHGALITADAMSRLPWSGVVLDNSLVSGRHAELRVHEGGGHRRCPIDGVGRSTRGSWVSLVSLPPQPNSWGAWIRRYWPFAIGPVVAQCPGPVTITFCVRWTLTPLWVMR